MTQTQQKTYRALYRFKTGETGISYGPNIKEIKTLMFFRSDPIVFYIIQEGRDGDWSVVDSQEFSN